MNLFEISKTYLAALENIEVDEDGCLTGVEDFDAIAEDFNAKMENVACYIKQLKIEMEDLKAIEKSYYERRKSKESKIENLEDYLSRNMKMLDMGKFETPKCKISFRKSVSVNVEDVESLEERFQRVKITIDADKTAIKEAILAGEEVKGASLEEKKNIQIK